MKKQGTMTERRSFWDMTQTDFEKAFFIANQELKKRAAALGGDAVVFMRQDIDMINSAEFSLQMYGTAVKIVGGQQ
jgi:uncharacterized protein YbjQ (UPF0145 family)